MRFARALIAAIVVASPAQADCPVSSFAAEKVKACARHTCRILTPSPEIERIRRGAYFEYVGLSLGEPPLTTWLAVDIDRHEVVFIQRYPIRAYERLKQAKEPATTRVTMRRVDGKFTDYARRRDIPPDKLGEVVCLANAMWKSQDEENVHFVTDAATGIYLLDAKQSKSLGGLGITAGDAKRLEDLLNSLKDPAWDWWDVFS